jgi:hypothetical protein
VFWLETYILELLSFGRILMGESFFEYSLNEVGGVGAAVLEFFSKLAEVRQQRFHPLHNRQLFRQRREEAAHFQ